MGWDETELGSLETPLVERAIQLASEGLVIDGGHHKQWYLEEILKALGATEEDYPSDWDEGIAP